MNPHQITRDFEKALCEYTGAKYAVTTNSCTMALLLATKWAIENKKEFKGIAINIPKLTYVSVPMSIIHAGGKVGFREENWCGEYNLVPLPVWDSARRFTSKMYRQTQFQCVSFHTTKILADTQGGAILHDNDQADAWFRRLRFDGRTEGVPPNEDEFTEIGYHCYMSPDVAARLVWKISLLPKTNDDLPNSDYPDLSKFKIFE